MFWPAAHKAHRHLMPWGLPATSSAPLRPVRPGGTPQETRRAGRWPALRTPPGAPHRPRASTSLTRRSVRYDARAKQSSKRTQAQRHGAPSCPRKADTRALRPCRACAGRRAAREFAIDISLTSLGSSQTLRRPHCSTDAASRFCSLSDTIAPAECVLRRQIWLPAPSAARARAHCREPPAGGQRPWTEPCGAARAAKASSRPAAMLERHGDQGT